MKKLIAILLLACLLIPSAGASAHVFITDNTGESGLVLHVLPDDDPIAGDTTQMFFDIKDKDINAGTYRFVLLVSDSAKQEIVDPAFVQSTGDQSFAASYVFPAQGLYRLKLTAYPLSEAAGTQKVFNYTQRVSRGTIGSPLDQPRYEWAEFGLIAAAAATGVVFLTAFTRRKSILSYTKWK